MKKLLGLIVALMVATQAYASIAVSPMKVEINANKVKTNYASATLDVRGDSREPIRFKVYPEYFTVNERSEMVTEEHSTSPNSLVSKLRYVPSEFTVMQGKSQKVRINIPNLNTLPDGESRAVLFIEDVNPKEFNIPVAQAGIGAQLIVKTRVGVPIYVDHGKVVRIGEIESFNIVKEKDGFYTEMKILSKGNSKVRYTGMIQIIKDKKLLTEYRLVDHVVAPDKYYKDKTKMDLSKVNDIGEFTVRAVLSYPDENGKRKNITKETVLKIQQGEM